MIRRRTVTVHGEQFSFWESAPSDPDAEVMVLVHGMAGSAHTWVAVLDELARRGDRRRVIVPELVGHGSSTAPWADYSLGGYATGIRDLLAALGIGHATIVGHSLGGGVVLHFAWAFPEYCERLVLVDSGGLGREVSPLLRAATLPGAEWVLPWITDRRALVTVRALAHLARRVLPGTSESTWESGRSFVSLADPVHRQAFLHTARSVVEPGGQRVRATGRLYLAEGLPTLIVWGADDSMIPLAHGQRAHELIPGSRLDVIADAGHFPHQDQPGEFTDRLVDFLDHTTPARRSPAEHAARIAAHAGESRPA